ncbi:hypothetical protein RLO149_c001250 [Roseobacter litoralis Och 149]|uniref:Uncharacterized protein n=1 Tax=Roseobacter litoralis (strain ATCC 49566 / DSM 6996 / JCM 21268 / NBRC 15278 / OCh 149) TaxID=391595 RepID=F7ZES6_ROSLO|nr:hypothetical protein RLO149_c001250 [Roseobacter litoralis Och 149]
MGKFPVLAAWRTNDDITSVISCPEQRAVLYRLLSPVLPQFIDAFALVVAGLFSDQGMRRYADSCADLRAIHVLHKAPSSYVAGPYGPIWQLITAPDTQPCFRSKNRAPRV